MTDVEMGGITALAVVIALVVYAVSYYKRGERD
jgi:hypothetical protein